MSNAPWNNAHWGPQPKYAILPVAAVLLGSWIAVGSVPPVEQVTVMKPLPDGAVAAGANPVSADGDIAIEVRYGVPTPRTIHLWK